MSLSLAAMAAADPSGDASNIQPQALPGNLPTRVRNSKYLSIRIAFVLPDARSNFVDKVEREIVSSRNFFNEHHIAPSLYRCDLSNRHRATALLNTLSDFDAIALMPLDYLWIDTLIDERARTGVPVITLFFDRPASRRYAFVGADNCRMGRTAGLLMGKLMAQASAKILVLSNAMHFGDQHELRIGFEQVLTESFKHLEAPIALNFSTDNAQALDAIFSQHTDAIGVYLTCDEIDNAALAGIRRGKPRVFIGHGLSQQTRLWLTEGMLDAVIDQELGDAIHAAGLAALDYVNGVSATDACMSRPIRIYLKENINI